jgi:tagatose-6-phosphate ketose/aldose isomerase
MTYLGFSDEDIERRGGSWTAREIRQQPVMWAATEDMLLGTREATQAFLAPLLARPDIRIILTGAGTSAFIGRCLQPDLLASLDRRVEFIPTTDLVVGPQNYFQRNVPTLLVSFARSGSSPESVAAAEFADREIADCHHLVITCNRDGDLYRRQAGRARSHVVLLPEATHDRGFAMTSSFSSMLYAALRLFCPGTPIDLERIGRAASALLEDESGLIASLTARQFERVVFLGSRGFAGLADEAALKVLELTDGEVAAIGNSPLGFRHGLKTFVNPETLVVIFLSNDPIVRRYDLDLLRELASNRIAGRILALSADAGDLGGIDCVTVPGLEGAPDSHLYFPFIVWVQQLALARSLELGFTPDNPSRSKTVSRVVAGVTIYRA